ncbi:MAG: hypothetical protein ACO23R_18880 [bacterium]
MKLATKSSGKSIASSAPTNPDVSLKPISSINWAKATLDDDWIELNARHHFNLQPEQSLPKERDTIVRAALSNYSKEELILAIVSSREGKLPKKIPKSKDAAITHLLDFLFKRQQLLDATSMALTSSVPAAAGEAGGDTPTGSVVTLSPSKKHSKASTSTDASKRR